LITKIKYFKQLAEKGRNSIHDLVEIRYNNEGNFEDGLKGAEDFVRNGNCDSKYIVDITKAKRELDIVNQILDSLNDTNGHLDKMSKILNTYEANLLGISGELNRGSKFKVTREDFIQLRFAIDNVKESHYKFIRKSL